MTEYNRKDDVGNPGIRILSWNIWNEKVTVERIECILDIILEKDPDFICLQEVTKEARFKIDNWASTSKKIISNRYHVTVFILINLFSLNIKAI